MTPLLPRRVMMAGAALLLAGIATGCGPKYPTLTFESRDRNAELRQPFALTAIARDAAGDWDVVLVSQGLERVRGSKPGRDLKPAKEAPVRQVVHLKLHWRPQRGAEPENPAAANATARWLVFGTPTPPSAAAAEGAADTYPDVIEYQGTAFVRPIPDGEGYTLVMREGTLHRTLLKGDMVDTLGDVRLDGKFWAREDAVTVANVLSELPPPTRLAVPTPPAATTRPAIR